MNKLKKELEELKEYFKDRPNTVKTIQDNIDYIKRRLEEKKK